MSMTIRVTHKSKSVEIRLKSLDKATKKGIKNAFFAIGKDLKATAEKLIIDPPKTGRIYRIGRGTPRMIHQASAPGQAPANMSGKLKDSVGYLVNNSTEMLFGAGNSSVVYAGYLENGTRKMRKRPYLIKAIDANAVKIATHIQDNIKKEVGE